MTRDELFVSEYQSAWLEEARDDRHPLIYRVRALQRAFSQDNGHAPFRPGEVGELLGVEDKANLQRAIRQAVARGLLSPLSGTTCLVAPSNVHRAGPGARAKYCKHLPRRRR